MSDATQSDARPEERLKAALWYSIGKTVDAVSVDQNINASPQFIGGLTELVHLRVTQAAADLEAFAKHAGRSTINAKDVLLLARNNEALHDALQQKADTTQNKKSGA